MKRSLARLLFFTAFTALAAAQSPPPRVTVDPRAAWMFSPVDVRSQRDPRSKQERRQRNAFADEHWGVSIPVWPESPLIVGVPKGEELWSVVLKRESGLVLAPGLPSLSRPELPDDPGNIWLIGTFESHRTILSASERSIYTEVSYRIQRLFGNQEVPGVQAGGLLDVARNGGTIKAPWGQVISYRVSPHFPPQPGHRYLLLVTRQPGNFYLEHKRWDLSTGTVVADCATEAARSAQGKSSLTGLTVSQVIELLEQRFQGRRFTRMNR